MQVKNTKLKKEIKSKIERIGVMEARLNDISKENELSSEVIRIYEKLLGICIEKVEDGENEFKVWIPSSNPHASQSRVLEARLEGKNVKGKGSNEEWRVTIEKLPSPQFMGLKVGQKMYYDEHTLANFYGMLKEVVSNQGSYQ